MKAVRDALAHAVWPRGEVALNEVRGSSRLVSPFALPGFVFLSFYFDAIAFERRGGQTQSNFSKGTAEIGVSVKVSACARLSEKQ